MDATLPSGPTEVHSDAPTAVVLAHATLALDEVVKAGNEAQIGWSRAQRALSTMVLGIMVSDRRYRLPPVVREALGGDFYEGPLLSEAQRLGWLRFNYTHGLADGGPSVQSGLSVTDQAPAGLLDMISEVGRV
jgi:hypothetical protein